MASHSLVFPPDFAEYEAIWESKGWCPGVKLVCLGKQYSLVFYDPVRLAQEVEDELQRGSVFYEKNLLVIPFVTRQRIEDAVAQLVECGIADSLIAD